MGSVVGARTLSPAQSCSYNSFTADTPVAMADGSSKPISAVEVGDEVVATDPQDGRTESREVVSLIRHGGQHTMVDVGLGDGTVIEATDGHPFWDVTTGRFTLAIDLEVGELVLGLDGRSLQIASVRVYGEDLVAYNLEIEGIHTYYAGETPVLVHNTCGLPADGSSMTVNEALDAGENWLGAGYSESVAGSGRFVSDDGTRVFRMGETDIYGAHGGGPHVNFAELVPNPARPGRLIEHPNNHIYLLDW